ncbi:hypothetical protein [Pseudomonas sp. CHM02]|uniref:hypothetical protein n=1 Tax=Pseudomonas sp. CHM02 TaxID=1463662 RepID=UPI0015A678CB|nr:hypothetical protein [Pseudomonas sp. CHM02]
MKRFIQRKSEKRWFAPEDIHSEGNNPCPAIKTPQSLLSSKDIISSSSLPSDLL